ncbi:MAG: rhomboid family intramembrane serine protease [Kofleriaceae bacterium]|nr:rhomboid family intramembrane serine protease [Kofleriaceae bacterium]
MSPRPPPQRKRIDWSQTRITRGALLIIGVQIGVSLVWLMADKATRATIGEYVLASPSQVFEHGRVWTLVTSPLLQPDFLSLLFTALLMWMLVPILERFWGTRRFYRFVAITSILGSAAGVLLGYALGRDVPIYGLTPFTYAATVAFGVIYARQPVQFFGVLPLSGRQFMWGIIGFLVLFVVLQQFWEQGAAYAAAMLAAAVMTSKRWSPALAWKRWRIARARARLSVLEGGAPKPKPKRSDERFIN